jgi:hypothetical protein
MTVWLGDVVLDSINNNRAERRLKKYMKFDFKKISAITTSALMLGMSMGVAAAASFPSPYSSSSSSGVGIVTGTGAGVDDTVAANSISSYLATKVQTTGGTPMGGDSYKFEKISTKFHLGDNITGVISSSLDDDELPNLLADGKYIDANNDEIDYTQKITIGAANQLTMFEDNDYAADQPTIGFKIPSAQNVLTYQLTFDDTLLVTDMPTTDLPIMNKEYYVLGNTSTTLTLLDSAEETVLTEGETVTVSGKSASIEYIGATEVKLNVDGEVTNSLAETETYKLADGSYIGIKDIMHDSKEGRNSKVEFSIGSGKLKITDGSDVQINDDAISGLVGTLGRSANTAGNITLAWAADDDIFIAEDSVITMPGFESVKLSFGGLNYPTEEIIEVKQGGDKYVTLENFPLKDGPADIDILYATTAGTFVGFGKDADNRLITGAEGASITFDKDDDDYFVVSWDDTNDAESYLMRFTNFVLDGSTNKTDLQYYQNGVWVTKKSGAKDGDSISIGSADITITTVTRSAHTVLLTNGTAATDFHTLHSKEGMTVYLPYHTANDSIAEGAFNATSAAGHNSTAFYLVMREEDENGNKYAGDWINITLGWDSSTTVEPEVSAVDTANTDATSTEILETDVWRDFTYSALATEILYNKPSSGQKSVKLVYHGDEVAASVYATSPETTITGGEVGNMVFTDAEKSSWQSRNVILVGGSCINSATATALGVTYPNCEVAFTASTGVGSGQYLIQSVGNAFTTGKIAVVVAGYSKADTAAAASRLVNQPTTVDTTAGNKYIGVVGVEGASTISKIA